MPSLNAKFKILLVAAFIFFVVISYSKTYKAGYKAGSDQQIVKQQKETDKFRKKLTEDFEVQLLKANKHSEKWKNEALKLREKLKIKPQKVIEYVTKIKKTSNCNYLGPDFYKMHNDIAGQFTERATIKK